MIGCVLAAGDAAVRFFEETNPDIPQYGTSGSDNDNPAEWIVNLTTQVAPSPTNLCDFTLPLEGKLGSSNTTMTHTSKRSWCTCSKASSQAMQVD